MDVMAVIKSFDRTTQALLQSLSKEHQAPYTNDSVTIHVFTITNHFTVFLSQESRTFLHHSRPPSPQPLTQKLLRRNIIRPRIPKPTPPIPSLRNNRPRTLPTIKPTATLLAIRVRSTRSRDELCARRDSSSRWWSTSLGSSGLNGIGVESEELIVVAHAGAAAT